MNTRAAATLVITDMISNGRSLSDSLPEIVKNFSDPRDKGFIQALCYGVTRWYFRLDAIAQLLIKKPLQQKDQDIHDLILLGLYQLIEMRIPDHAAVSETVSVTKLFEKEWAKNFVNAVLRQYQRNSEEINQTLQKNWEAVYAHPTWLIKKIKKNWPDNWQAILEANNQHPPFSLRINQTRNAREDYLKQFTDQNPAHIISETHYGIILETPIDVIDLPGFKEGDVSVQDGAAQLAAELLQLEPGHRVLDACAAPGGKTAHILEMEPKLSELIALDCDKKRLDSVKENLQRLNLSATCLAADAADLDSWWDGLFFDRILLDAPCSASGVIRRHPDIKLLRIESDIEKFSRIQLKLLKSVWKTLAPNGILIYATCSIFSEENDLVLTSFLDQQSDAIEEKINASWGMERVVGRQILPGISGLDGFYYARLRKRKI